VDAQ
jgi:hypothetical protein